MGLVAIISPHEWQLEQKGDRKFLPGGDLGPLFWQCRGARRCSSTAAWSLALSNGYDYAA